MTSMTLLSLESRHSAREKQYSFTRRELLVSRPNLIWRIDSGVVRTITYTESGSVITLGYWNAGDVVGQPLSRMTNYMMECLTPVNATSLQPQEWPQELGAIFAHNQQTEEIFSIIHQERVSDRLFRFLNWLAHKFGRQVPQGILIDVRLTHQDLAQAIGTTRVSITRLLCQFEERNLIQRPRSQSILCCFPLQI
jgi:CRP-like cAMP-binding protein